MSDELDLRTDKSCSGSRSLPISESFTASTTVTMFSPAFRASAGTTINVQLLAELDDPNGIPGNGSVGVTVHQCCDVVDSQITPQQTIGRVGPAGSPEATSLSVTLVDACTLSTHPDGNDSQFVYYLRLRISDSSDRVKLSYSIT
ncbi:hypothetical protein [Streptomyces sp. NRRL S-495]|uniref:hypothetical protein n=1 Tax=Streptomyces sp. NRRL S-495 TaxID=1609133 RepID=UPI0005F95141|nr:hypothetical protein [Streptomyces sp. NRRL S-495]KJY29469.1 hypothetical protein VR45_29835 [Streptomyces sp. NRRL S-495]